MAAPFGLPIGDIGKRATELVDKAKAIAIAGVIATFFGLVGVFTLAASMAALLAIWLPWPAALAITAATFLAITAISLWVGALSTGAPSTTPGAEAAQDQSMEQALASLTDLPLEAARKMIAERPIAALAIFSGFGMLIARRPEIAIKLVERLVQRFS